jgi:hypothetical protein
MEKKFSVAEFAALVGTTAKTIYQKIDNYENLPVNEQLATVKEKVKGREITFVVTDSEQIEYFKNLYSKNIVNECNYYENVTNNNGYSQVNNSVNNFESNNNNKNNSDMFDKLMTLNETYLNRIETVTNELMEYKSRSLLLEDKASREGMYLNNIRELETENNKLKNSNKVLVTILSVIISVLLTVLLTLVIVNNKVKNGDDAAVSKVENVAPVPESMPIKKK